MKLKLRYYLEISQLHIVVRKIIYIIFLQRVEQLEKVFSELCRLPQGLAYENPGKGNCKI